LGCHRHRTHALLGMFFKNGRGRKTARQKDSSASNKGQGNSTWRHLSKSASLEKESTIPRYPDLPKLHNSLYKVALALCCAKLIRSSAGPKSPYLNQTRLHECTPLSI